jgi:hypothetical protein
MDLDNISNLLKDMIFMNLKIFSFVWGEKGFS